MCGNCSNCKKGSDPFPVNSRLIERDPIKPKVDERTKRRRIVQKYKDGDELFSGFSSMNEDQRRQLLYEAFYEKPYSRGSIIPPWIESFSLWGKPVSPQDGTAINSD